MDAEFVRERLFRPFDSTKGSKGMGIGAYQVREYARGAGRQTSEVQSSCPGEGTQFSVLGCHYVTKTKPKLLIVEDDLGLQKQLKWCFDEYEVLMAATRAEALALAAALRAAGGAAGPRAAARCREGVSEGMATLQRDR